MSGIASERICGLTGVWTQSGNRGNREAKGAPGALTGRAESDEFTGLGRPALRSVKSPQCDSPPRTAVPQWNSDEQRKIAAIGIHISRCVTSHGFALNVSTDLDYFKFIVPCGISDRPVTSIAQELAGERPVPSLEQIAHSVSLNFGRVFARQMLWLDSLDALLATTPAPESEPQSDEDRTKAESTTIGVPLKVPQDLRKLRRELKAPGLLDEKDFDQETV